MCHRLSQIQFSFTLGILNSVCSKPNLVTSGLDYNNKLAGPYISTHIPPMHSLHSSQRGFLKFILIMSQAESLPGASPCFWDEDVAGRTPTPFAVCVAHSPPCSLCSIHTGLLLVNLFQGFASVTGLLPRILPAGFSCFFLYFVYC